MGLESHLAGEMLAFAWGEGGEDRFLALVRFIAIRVVERVEERWCGRGGHNVLYVVDTDGGTVC